MKKIYTGLLLGLLISAIHAQDPAFEWVNIIGGPDDQEGKSVTVDASGDLYFAGNYKGTVDFDPGAGVFNMVSVDNSHDVFIQKLDAEGNLIWVRSVGGIGPDGDYVSITTDAWGNVLVAGGFQGTADFDPGIGTYLLSSNGNRDWFVLKLTSEGDFVWARSTGGSYWDRSLDIATDVWGNVIITGQFAVKADFDPGEGTYYLSANIEDDAFIQKLDSDGNFLWAISLGSPKSDAGISVATDTNGNIYTVGTFNQSVDFDPGPGTFTINSKGTVDGFIQKLDPDGNFIWAGSVGGTHLESAVSIFSDALGHLYVIGGFTNTGYVDLGTGIHELSADGYEKVFVLKTDTDANIHWARAIAGTDFLHINSVTADKNGNVFSTGGFGNTADFDPGEGIFNLSAGFFNPFIQKLDSEGNFVWAGCLKGLTDDWQKESIVTDNRGNIYLAGTFNNSVDMDPGEGVHEITAHHYDAFLLKLSQCIPNTGIDVLEACGSFTWIDGSTYTSSNNTATHVLTNAGGCDSVVTLDLTINQSTTGTDVITACDSYTWIDGNTYTESNNSATHILINERGCDSVVTLYLTINQSTKGTDVITSCDSYTWVDGNTYTESNNSATHILINERGCDSVVSLGLIINQSNTGTDVITACDSYTWIDGNTYTESNNNAMHMLTNEAGCDSIVMLNLSISYPSYISDVITACDSITWIDGNTYAESNNSATYTFRSAAGCDSVVLLDLTVNRVDASVTVSGTTVTAVLTGADYQWIDCNNFNAVIEGATGQSFTATASGLYAVEVTKEECIKTSACVPITVEQTGVEEDPIFREVSIFPNPTKGLVHIELGSLRDVSIIVYDTEGRVIYRQEQVQGTVARIELQAKPSLYLIELNEQGKRQVYKFIMN